jgi:uncharacterized RDD family membrane protein YckC
VSSGSHVTTIPEAAQPHQGQPAGIASRSAAACLDLGVLLLLLLGAYVGWAVVSFPLDPRGFSAPAPSQALIGTAYLATAIGYLAACWWLTGRTPGQHVMGLRVRRQNGAHVGLLRSLLRGLVCVLFPIGLLWVVVSSRNLAIHDLLLRTWVVYDWAEGR